MCRYIRQIPPTRHPPPPPPPPPTHPLWSSSATVWDRQDSSAIVVVDWHSSHIRHWTDYSHQDCSKTIVDWHSSQTKRPACRQDSSCMSSSPISYSFVDEHITILCIFILSWIKFCLNQDSSRTMADWHSSLPHKACNCLLSKTFLTHTTASFSTKAILPSKRADESWGWDQYHIADMPGTGGKLRCMKTKVECTTHKSRKNHLFFSPSNKMKGASFLWSYSDSLQL